jgi:hypothetical protein
VTAALPGRLLAVAALGIGIGLAACDSAPPADVQGHMWDSAGIRIIDLPEPTSSPVDTLEIDAEWGPPGELDLGELVDVAVIADGRVALLDRMQARVILLAPDGSVEASFGGAGEGPGEFSPYGLNRVVATDSSLLVPDIQLQRMNEFSIDGELLDVGGIEAGRGPGEGAGLYAVEWRPHPDGGLAYRAITQAGDLIARLDVGIHDTLHLLPMPDRGPNLILGPALLWDLDPGGHLLVARTDRGAVELRDTSDGSPLWIARGIGEERDVTERERSHLESILLSSGRGDRWVDELPEAEQQALLASVEFARRVPVIAALHGAPDGRVWVQRARSIDEMGESILAVANTAGAGGLDWDILEADGAFHGSVRLPEGFQPTRFVPGWVYGITEDALGVQGVGRIDLTPQGR